MEGPEYFNRFIVVEFPTMQDAINCFESENYQAAAAFAGTDPERWKTS